MNRELTLRTGADIDNRTMEGMLIETYGCMSLNRVVSSLHAHRDRKRVEPEFYIDVNTMEGMLVETYGCMSLSNRIINLEAGRDRRRVRSDAMWSPALLNNDTSALSA
ncbi:MAG: hypothetical protein C0392_11230 [Syntrophus sp. (in: bacteria)]|nr:hypothetical protein [Syntrophus sp. (in: bacteria)]